MSVSVLLSSGVLSAFSLPREAAQCLHIRLCSFFFLWFHCRSYVQRFKRAKRFLKRAMKHFDVCVIQAPSVVDYDVLNWGTASTAMNVDSDSATWTTFVRLHYATTTPVAGDGSPLAGADYLPPQCMAYYYVLRRRNA